MIFTYCTCIYMIYIIGYTIHGHRLDTVYEVFIHASNLHEDPIVTECIA